MKFGASRRQPWSWGVALGALGLIIVTLPKLDAQAETRRAGAGRQGKLLRHQATPGSNRGTGLLHPQAVSGQRSWTYCSRSIPRRFWGSRRLRKAVARIVRMPNQRNIEMIKTSGIGVTLAAAVLVAAAVSERGAARRVEAQATQMPVFQVDTAWPQSCRTTGSSAMSLRSPWIRAITLHVDAAQYAPA